MTYFKKIKIFSLTLLLFLNLPAASEDYTANSTLAEVNGKPITLGHVIAAVARLPEEYSNLEPDYLLDGILDQIVKQEVMAQTLDDSKLLIKVSLENEIRSLKAKYAVEQQMQDYPTTEMVQNAYQELISVTENTEEFNASHILVETEDRALEILKLLETGIQFTKLAKENSTGPSAPNGGQLGWFGAGQMVPEFETAVMVLEIGKVSQPVKTQFGWHLIKLNDRRTKPLPSLEELQPELIQQLNQDRIDELVKIKSEKAGIVLVNKAINSSSIRNLELLK